HPQFPRSVVMQFNPEGSRVVLVWSQTKQMTAEEANAEKDRQNRLERLLKVLDVATGNSLYDLNLGEVSLFAVRPYFFPDGKRLALVMTPSPRPRGRPRG